MVAEAVAFGVLVFGLLAEGLHARRVRRVAILAFGDGGKPGYGARLAPYVRAAGLAAVAWGLVTLLLIPPRSHRAQAVDKEKLRHLLLVLDVSPSMRLEDAGPTKKQARIKRVKDLMESFFLRAPEPFRISVVATYNGAKPVVIDTLDMEVVRNVLGDLPMHFAFEVGETRLFEGLKEAARLAHDWTPHSATMVLLSDGDTVPATGMPKMPASISQVLVVGVGDPRVGSFIDGRHSRQAVSTLRQIANRLRGTYHNGNEHQISTDTLLRVAQPVEAGTFEKLTRREYALLACAAGALSCAAIPVLLTYFGTRWRPGVYLARRSSIAGADPVPQAHQQRREFGGTRVQPVS